MSSLPNDAETSKSSFPALAGVHMHEDAGMDKMN